MRAYILNTATGRIFGEYSTVAAAEDRLEQLDYAAPRIARWFAVYVVGEDGLELVEDVASPIACRVAGRRVAVAA